MLDLEGVQAVQLAMIAHCELMGDRMAILDPPPGLNAQQVKRVAGRQGRLRLEVRRAVLAVGQGLRPGRPARTCSCRRRGHMAGIWARSDDTRGVHKAPANEVVRGAIDLETAHHQAASTTCSTRTASTASAPSPAAGIRVWGARTLSSDPAWRYINVRRLFNYVEESILDGTQWVVFEPNDHDLWAARSGARSPRSSSACGATARCSAPRPSRRSTSSATTRPTRPRSSTPARSSCEIGIAPVKPAEFVVFRLAQFSGGASLTE